MGSTEVGHGSGEWAFDCDTPQGPFAVLPMLGIDYRMPLSSTNTTRPGRPSSACASRCPTPCRRGRSSSTASRSRGTAASLGRVRCEQTSCTARVRNQPGGTASLRVSATDAGGRSGSQQILNVYEVFNCAATLLLSPPSARARTILDRNANAPPIRSLSGCGSVSTAYWSSRRKSGAACFGVSPVEPEGELVEVVGQVLVADPVVQGASVQKSEMWMAELDGGTAPIVTGATSLRSVRSSSRGRAKNCSAATSSAMPTSARTDPRTDVASSTWIAEPWTRDSANG